MKHDRFFFWSTSLALVVLYFFFLIGHAFALEALVGCLCSHMILEDWKTLRQKEKEAKFKQIMEEFQCKIRQNQK